MHLEKRTPEILSLGFRQAALPQLKTFIDLLWSSNNDLNLVSRKMTFEELIDNHIIDCLLPLPYFPKDARIVADFGTGGGLPALPYAIQFPEIYFRLFEKSPMKRDYLQRCLTITPNLKVEADIPINLGSVDLVVARGFKPIDVILDMSRTYYSKGGKYFLLKGRLEKIDEELSLTRKKFKDLKVQVIPLKSPVLEVERHLVLINFK